MMMMSSMEDTEHIWHASIGSLDKKGEAGSPEINDFNDEPQQQEQPEYTPRCDWVEGMPVVCYESDEKFLREPVDGGDVFMNEEEALVSLLSSSPLEQTRAAYYLRCFFRKGLFSLSLALHSFLFIL